jgi:hypothetical protein
VARIETGKLQRGEMELSVVRRVRLPTPPPSSAPPPWETFGGAAPPTTLQPHGRRGRRCQKRSPPLRGALGESLNPLQIISESNFRQVPPPPPLLFFY